MDFRSYSKPQSLYLNQRKVLERCYVAKNMFHKMRGLLGTKTLSFEEGLLIPQCQSVHTFFMRYSIDVCFLNQQLCVIRLLPGLRPWRITGWAWRAHYTLEAIEGWGKQYQVQVGDALQLR